MSNEPKIRVIVFIIIVEYYNNLKIVKTRLPTAMNGTNGSRSILFWIVFLNIKPVGAASSEAINKIHIMPDGP